MNILMLRGKRNLLSNKKKNVSYYLAFIWNDFLKPLMPVIASLIFGVTTCQYNNSQLEINKRKISSDSFLSIKQIELQQKKDSNEEKNSKAQLQISNDRIRVG